MSKDYHKRTSLRKRTLSALFDRNWENNFTALPHKVRVCLQVKPFFSSTGGGGGGGRLLFLTSSPCSQLRQRRSSIIPSVSWSVLSARLIQFVVFVVFSSQRTITAISLHLRNSTDTSSIDSNIRYESKRWRSTFKTDSDKFCLFIYANSSLEVFQ